ncbi:MAG: ISAzo13 family transposase [Deltaproteobacteria bacterium]|jgi:hypothetical protein|nr:ISAzo13 family transposase [Deltaproteobacteria bacterium]
MDIEERIRQDFEAARGGLNERTLRAFVAEMAASVGYGGVALVHRATGVARSTIKRGIEELSAPPQGPEPLTGGRIRREGGGRAPLTVRYPGLNDRIEAALRPEEPAAGERPVLKWTLDSTRGLSERLREAGVPVSPSTVRKQLKSLGYCLQTMSDRLLCSGDQPDGDAQFAYIAERAALEISRGNPVLSVETRRLSKSDEPPPARFKPRDYPEALRPSAMSRGIYDLERLKGASEISTDRSDSEFACHSLYGWWKRTGRQAFPGAVALYVAVGRGGCSFRSRAVWLSALSELSDKIRLPIGISHFRPGTSRWDPRLVRRVLSFWSTGWKDECGPEDEPRFETAVRLVTPQAHPAPFPVVCCLNHRAFAAERPGTGPRLLLSRLAPCGFQGDLNYTVLPARKARRPSGRRRLK